MKAAYPPTPDGRYFVVKGRLWRCTNLSLPPETMAILVKELMNARRAKGEAMRKGDTAGREQARQKVDLVKHQLGERGPFWWMDSAQTGIDIWRSILPMPIGSSAHPLISMSPSKDDHL